MRKILVRNCSYATNPVTWAKLCCDVYVLIDDSNNMLWHENLFLCEIAKSHSLNTAKASASDLLSFSSMAQHIGGWKNVTKRDMAGYLHGELFQSKRHSEATMMRHIETIKKFYAWASDKGYILTSPDFDWNYKHLYTKADATNQAYTATQHSYHSAYVDHETFGVILSGVKAINPFIAARDEIALLLGYKTGTRSHEVLKLDTLATLEKINSAKDRNSGVWATASIRVIGKGSKSRDLLIPPELCEKIIKYIQRYRRKLGNGKGPLICTAYGTPIKDTKYASTVFAKACITAKVTRNSRQGYHRLRKSFGTHLVDDCYREGRDPWVELPRRLGHNDLDTTKRYIHFDALLHGRSRVLSELKMTDSKYSGIQRKYRSKGRSK